MLWLGIRSDPARCRGRAALRGSRRLHGDEADHPDIAATLHALGGHVGGDPVAPARRRGIPGQRGVRVARAVGVVGVQSPVPDLQLRVHLLLLASPRFVADLCLGLLLVNRHFAQKQGRAS